MGFYRRFGKRALDILLCGAGLAVLSPVFAALALLVRLDSPGPVFFAQKRIGRDHKTFHLYISGLCGWIRRMMCPRTCWAIRRLI